MCRNVHLFWSLFLCSHPLFLLCSLFYLMAFPSTQSSKLEIFRFSHHWSRATSLNNSKSYINHLCFPSFLLLSLSQSKLFSCLGFCYNSLTRLRTNFKTFHAKLSEVIFLKYKFDHASLPFKNFWIHVLQNKNQTLPRWHQGSLE